MPGPDSPFPDHTGVATRGADRIPLAQFREEVRRHGRTLEPPEREHAVRRFLHRPVDSTPVEGPWRRIAVCGGIYNNHLALSAFLARLDAEHVDATYCLGDLGGFGPNPEKVWPLLEQDGVRTIQGNYEQSLASGAEDCNCGYTDPRDNHYATISYEYTAARCSAEFKAWMGALPARRRARVGDRTVLMIHGSPRRVNEFLFESTSSIAFLETLLDQERCDALLCTHTGLHWQRRLPSGRLVANVGVLGRPANDGTPRVWFAIVEADGDSIAMRHEPLDYDHLGLAEEMRAEGLPEPFVETILGGWWTTCLEILPASERAAGRY